MFVFLLPALIIIPAYIRQLRENKKAYPTLPKLSFSDCDKALEDLNEAELLYGQDSFAVCPSGGCDIPISQWTEDICCPNCKFLNSSEKEALRVYRNTQLDFRPGLGSELDDTEILYFPDTIWCNGKPLKPLDAESLQIFMEIKNSAHLKELYNGIPYPEGHRVLLIDWFRLKGVADTVAARLVDDGLKPWEFDQNW